MPVLKIYITKDSKIDELYEMLKKELTFKQLLDLGTKIAMKH